MARYKIGDTIVDTEKAEKRYRESRNWDGSNWISVQTEDQWEYETLYKSKNGKYYIEYSSAWQGSHPYAEWVSEKAAARWLLLNEDEIPEDLREAAEAVIA